MTNPSTPSGAQTQVIDLGTVDVHTNVLSIPLTINLPPNAVSIEFVGQTFSDPTARVVVYRIESPDGRLYDYASLTNPMKVQPPTGPGSFSVLVPNSPSLSFSPGMWTIKLLGSKETTASVKAIITTAPSPALTSGVLNMNLFFVGLSDLNATSAQTDPNFQSIVSKVRDIYRQVGTTIGNPNYFDVTGADAITYRDLQESDLGALMKLSSNAGTQQNAVNMFFVNTINGGSGLSGYIILGESAGIPGVALQGTTGSGVQ